MVQARGSSRSGNGRYRRTIGRRNVETQFEPSRPDVVDFVPYGDKYLCVGLWNDSSQWSYLGRTKADENSDIFRSYDGEGIPNHVPALVAAAGLYLNDRKLPRRTRTKLESFVAAMEDAGYAHIAE